MKIHRYLLIILILLITLGQFSRLPLGDSNVSVYINDLLLPVIIGLWFIDVVRRNGKFKLPYLTTPIVLFILIGIVSLIWNSQYLSTRELVVSSLYLWRWLTYVGLYFVSYDVIKSQKTEDGSQKIECLETKNQQNKELKNQDKEVRFFVNLLIGVGFVIALLGLVQYIFFPDFSSMVQHGWDPHYFRVLSTFFDPNYVGAFLVLSLTLILVMSLELKSWQKLSVNKAIIAIVLLLAIVLTFSRSTYLMFVVSIGIVGLMRSWRLIVLGLLVGVITLFFVPRVQERVIGGFINIDDSASFRFESWEKGLTIAKENPVIGVGYNSYRYAQIRYDLIQPWREDQIASHASSGVDSSLLLILATTGVLGFLVYVWFLFRQVLLSGISFFKGKSSWSRILGLTMLAGVVGLVVHSQFVNSLLYPFILAWIMIMMGIMEGSK